MVKYVVRCGVMRMLGVFSPRSSDEYCRGDRVIARTNRGLEVGEVLCEATDETVAQLPDPPTGQILRGMTSEDENELHHMQTGETEEFDRCDRIIRKSGLNMQLVDVEHVFGGERIVVFYLAEGRVDFRDLVKMLAAEFQTRIEMRQIGVRDEAKLLADYGDCGKPVCCNTHLSQMPPVSMKMAKLQKATLDPTKISGRCGRLKCCLRYEYPSYVKLQKELPPIGAEVVMKDGRARVLNQHILTRQLLVQTEDNRRLLVDASQVSRDVGNGADRDRGEQADGRQDPGPDNSPQPPNQDTSQGT
jgi:cell fate regulator YaaT (PSP1 superfamily)